MQQLPVHFQLSAEDNSAPNRTLGFSSPLPAIGESEAPPPLTVEMPRPQSLTRQRRRYSTFAGLSFESPSGRLATGKLGQREKTTLAEVATPNGESKSLTKERQRYRTFAGFIGDNNAMMTNDSTANRKATIETPVSTTKTLILISILPGKPTQKLEACNPKPQSPPKPVGVTKLSWDCHFLIPHKQLLSCLNLKSRVSSTITFS
jgi:hypothetical protein